MEEEVPATMTGDPVLRRFRAALDEMYGSRLDRVILFGSRARGDATMESDYDVAVFLKVMPDRWAEFDRLAALQVTFLEETGEFLQAIPFLAGALEERTPLMWDIRREGVDF